MNNFNRLCKFNGYKLYLCLFLFLAFIFSNSASFAAVWYVNGSSCGDSANGGMDNDCSAPDKVNRPLKSIQDAINKASAGDTIKVYPYSYPKNTFYNETLLVSKTLNLEIDTEDISINSAAPKIVINGLRDWDLLPVEQRKDIGRSNAVIIWNNGACGSIKDFIVRGGYPPENVENGAAILISGEGTNPLLSNLEIKKNDFGIIVRYGAAPQIKGCSIYDNKRSAIGVLDGSSPVIGGGDDWSGPDANLIFANSRGMAAEDCDNPGSDCEREVPQGCAAVAVLDGSSPRIWGNNIYSNAYSGIVAASQSAPTIKGNKIYSNGSTGIGVFSSENEIEIINNYIASNQKGLGIRSSGNPCEKIKIQNNDIINNGGGVYACDAYIEVGGVDNSGNTQGNRIANNNGNGVYLFSGSEGDVSFNNIINNQAAGVKLFNGSSGLIENNLIAHNGCYYAINNSCCKSTPEYCSSISGDYGQVEVRGGIGLRINNNVIVGENYYNGAFEGSGILVTDIDRPTSAGSEIGEIKNNIICRAGVGIRLKEDSGLGTIGNFKQGSVDQNLVMSWNSLLDTDGVQDGYVLGGVNLPGEYTYYYGQKDGSFGDPAKYIFNDSRHQSVNNATACSAGDFAKCPDYGLLEDVNSPVYNLSSDFYQEDYLGLRWDFKYIDSGKSFNYKFGGTISSLNPPAADVECPEITEIVPAEGSIDVSCDQNILVRIKDAGDGIDENSLIVKLDGLTGGTLNLGGDAGNLRAVLNPGALLSSGTEYTVIVSVKDSLNNSNRITSKFTTASLCQGTDTNPPQINIYPQDGASSVSISDSILFTVRDSSSGVDPDSVDIQITDSFLSTVVIPGRTCAVPGGGLLPDYTFAYTPKEEHGFLNNEFKYGTNYTLRVQARDYNNNLGSKTVYFMTQNDNIIPSDVTQLSAEVSGYDSIKLTWIPSDDNDCDVADQPYTLYINSGEGYPAQGRYLTIDRVCGNYTVTGLRAGIYDFKLTVTDASGNSSAGAEVKNIQLASSPVFSDDFQGFADSFESDLSKWASLGGADWQIINNVLKASGDNGELTVKDIERGNFTLEAKVKIDSAGSAWFILRKAEGSAIGAGEYAVRIGLGKSGNIGIYKLSLNGNLEELAAGDSSIEIFPGNWYSVKMTASGNILKLYLDSAPNPADIFQISAIDYNASFQGETLGIWQPQGNGTVYYDDIEIHYNKTEGGVYNYNSKSAGWSHEDILPSDGLRKKLQFAGIGEGKLYINPLSLPAAFRFKVKVNLSDVDDKAGILFCADVNSANGYLAQVYPGSTGNIKFYKLTLQNDTVISSILGSGDCSIGLNQEYELEVIKRSSKTLANIEVGDFEVKINSYPYGGPALTVLNVSIEKPYEYGAAGLFAAAPSSGKVIFDDLQVTSDLKESGTETVVDKTFTYNQIQTIISAANPGDTIIFSAGDYNIGSNTIAMKDSVNLIARPIDSNTCGAKGVTIRGSSTLIQAADKAIIRGFKLWGNNNTGAGIWSINTSCIIEDNEIVNCYDGIRMGGWGLGEPIIQNNCIHDNSRFGINSSADNTTSYIINNDIYRNGNHGIANQDSAFLQIYSNHIYKNYGAGIANKDRTYAVISQNNIISSNNLQGIAIADEASPIIDNNEISGNHMDGIGIGCPLEVILSGNLGIQTVEGTLDGTPLYSDQVRLSDDASPVDGIYEGMTLVVNSADPQKIIILSYLGGSSKIATLSGPYTVRPASGVSFSITAFSATCDTSASPVISNNKIIGNLSQGIACRSMGAVDIDNNIIASNNYGGIGFAYFGGAAGIRNNIIRHQLNRLDAFGLKIMNSNGAFSVSGNTIWANYYGGIGMQRNAAQKIEITDNDISSNGAKTPKLETLQRGHAGIQMDFCQNVTLARNKISGNASDGIDIKNSSPYIGFNFNPTNFTERAIHWSDETLSQGNYISNNKRNGIGIYGEKKPGNDLYSTKPVIQGNIIIDNVKIGIGIQGQFAQPSIICNRITSNSEASIGLRNSGNGIIQNNYSGKIKLKEASKIHLKDGNTVRQLIGENAGTEVLAENNNIIYNSVSLQSGSKFHFKHNNDILGGIDMRKSTLYLQDHNRIRFSGSFGITKQNYAALYIWDGNEFSENQSHIRSHGYDFYIIGYENFDPVTKEYGGKSSPNIFRGANPWGSIGAIEIKNNDFTCINNRFYDNGLRDAAPVIRYGIAGGGVFTVKETVFDNNGSAIYISGAAFNKIYMNVEKNEFTNHLYNVIGFSGTQDVKGDPSYAGYIKDNKFINNPNGLGIGFNTARLCGDFYITGNQFYGNKQAIGLTDGTNSNGFKYIIGGNGVDEGNVIYGNRASGLAFNDSNADIDIIGNSITGNGINPPPDFNYGSGIMMKDYTGKIKIDNNLIERNLDSGIQFKQTTVSIDITNNIIRYNGNAGDEGGIRLQDGSICKISGNKIYGNFDSNITLRGTPACLVDALIEDNEIYSAGWDWSRSSPGWNQLDDPRGIAVEDYSTVKINRNKIFGNGNGPYHNVSSGISFNIDAGGETPLITNNFIYGHRHYGIGMVRLPSGIKIYGNTIVNNDYGVSRGYNASPFYSSQVLIKDSIIWSNLSGAFGKEEGSDFDPVVTYCNVQGGVYAGEGNISESPIFANESEGNLRIDINSPCKDKGTFIAELDKDFDGDLRPIGSLPEIGADEIPNASAFDSALAYDSTGKGPGIQSGDKVVITFATGTNALPINASNIDNILRLNNYHSWLDKGATVGNVAWSTQKYVNDTLTITLNNTGRPPTVSAGDVISLYGDIQDQDGANILGSKVIEGSFDGIEGLAAHWRFDEFGVDPKTGDERDFYDSSSYNNNGRLGSNGELSNNNDPSWDAGKLNSALKFDGVNDGAFIPAPANLYDITKNISVALWVKHNNLDGTQRYFTMPGNKIILRGKAGKLSFVITLNDTTVHELTPAAAQLSANKWHYVAAAYDGATLYLYLDGKLIDTMSVAGSLIPMSGNIALGGGNTAPFDGYLDEVSVYNRILNADEILSLYDVDSPYISGLSPDNNSYSNPVTTGITLHVKDDNFGVDKNSIVMKVQGQTVEPLITGKADDYTLYYEPPADFSYSEKINVSISAKDLAEIANILNTNYEFTINTPANRPINELPGDNEINVTWLPLLRASLFSDNDLQDTQTAAQWQICSDDTFDYLKLIYNTVATDGLNNHNVGQLLTANETYYFRVRYQDKAGDWSEYSQGTRFSVKPNSAPDAPSNLLPENGSQNLPLTVTLSASSFSDSDQVIGDYHVKTQWQVSERIDFNAPVMSFTDEAQLTSFNLSGLLPDQTYYFRTRYQDAYGLWSGFSSPTSFKTGSYAGEFLDHYTIEYDPDLAAEHADIRMAFTPRTASGAATSSGPQMIFEAYNSESGLPAPGALKIAGSFTSDGKIALADVLLAQTGEFNVRLRYILADSNQPERIRIRLRDNFGKVSPLSNPIYVSNEEIIVSGDFETTDLSGWTASGESSIYDNFMACGSGKAGGSYPGDGNEGVGVLKSENFTLLHNEISFCYGHRFGTYNKNYIGLYLASNDTLIAVQKDDLPFINKWNSATVYWNIDTQYLNKEVYLKIVDDDGRWLAIFNVDNLRFMKPLDHYHIDFDPNIASKDADFKIKFTPHTVNEDPRIGNMVELIAYKADGITPAAGALKMVTGYDSDGLPVLADPVADASAGGQISVKLRYALTDTQLSEQIRIKLRDNQGIESALSSPILVMAEDVIVNGDFEGGDTETGGNYSGWFVENGALGIFSNKFACGTGKMGGSNPDEAYTGGIMRSEVFTIKKPEIAFCFGQKYSYNSSLYVTLHLASDNTEIAKKVMDLTPGNWVSATCYWQIDEKYLGRGAYIKISDLNTAWKADFNVDNIRYPQIVTPINTNPVDVTGVSLTPKLQATGFNPGDTGGAHSYSHWEISDDSGMNNIIYSVTTSVDLISHTVVESLNVNTIYYFRVKYKNNFGLWSEYSTPSSFRTLTSDSAPYEPSNVYPTLASGRQIRVPILASSDFSDPDYGDTLGETRWQISSGSGAAFAGGIIYDKTGGAKTTHRVSSPLPALGIYYWRVRHRDNKGAWSEYSEDTAFSVEAVPSNTVASWHFDEGEGIEAADANGAYPGTVDENIWTTPGKLGTAIDLNGTSYYVRQSFAPNYASSDSFSYDLWFKTDMPGSATLLGSVGETGDNDAALEINIAGGQINCRIADNTGQIVTLSSSKIINNGQWHYLALIRDGAAKELKLYVDNEAPVTASDSTANINLLGFALAIGALNNKDTINNYFYGIIDEVNIYNNAISNGWISDAYNEAAPYLSGHNPLPGASGVLPYKKVSVDVLDDGAGVARQSIKMNVAGLSGDLEIIEIAGGYRLEFTPAYPYCSAGSLIRVSVDACDLLDKAMAHQEYTFNTIIDGDAPSVSGVIPAPDSVNNLAASNIELHITDGGAGVDKGSLRLFVKGQEVSTSITASPDPGDYRILYANSGLFNFGETVGVEIQARDLAGNIMSYNWSFTISAAPDTPANILPANKKTGESLRPVLTISDFADANLPDDGQYAVQWQISKASNDYSAPNLVYDAIIQDTVKEHQITLTLDSNTVYFWRARYQDNHGCWSNYSTESYFTTGLIWQGTKGLWRFDENGGNFAYDGSGNNYNAQLSSPADLWTSGGKNNSALTFPGNDVGKYVTLPREAMNNLLDFSIEFWAKVPQEGIAKTIISGARSGQLNEFTIANPENLTVYINGTPWYSTASINNNTWRHIAITRSLDYASDKIYQTLRIYQDGNFLKETTTLTTGALSIDTGGLIIGQKQKTVGGGFEAADSFKGLLDELVIYDFPLDGDQVMERFRGIAAPYTDSHKPARDSLGASPYTSVSFHLKDAGSGIDLESVRLYVEDFLISSSMYDISGSSSDYTLTYTPSSAFSTGQEVNIKIEAADLAGNKMLPDIYTFTVLTSDAQSPYLDSLNPGRDAIMTATGANITLRVKDNGYGVDLKTLFIKRTITGEIIYDGSVPNPSASYPYTTISGDINDYLAVYDPPADFGNGSTVEIYVSCNDLADNSMSDIYNFLINRMPRQPENITPSEGATGVALKPILTASAFQDMDQPADTHLKTQWQITKTAGDYSAPVYDTQAIAANTSHTLTRNLQRNTKYYWRVRYQDSMGAWSEYSYDTSFTTTP